MIKNEIELKALNSFGMCRAYVESNLVTIKVYGVSGCLKAWLTGEKTVELGNLVNGSITKEIDTSPYDGILLTQSGRQMFYGKIKQGAENCTSEKSFVTEKNAESPVLCKPNKEKKEIIDFNDGFNWTEITTREYPSENLSVRYILSHKCFYNAFLLHGRYYYGTKGDIQAIAIECDIKNEPHPLLHLSAYATYKDGYMIVCADTKNQTFCSYE